MKKKLDQKTTEKNTLKIEFETKYLQFTEILVKNNHKFAKIEILTKSEILTKNINFPKNLLKF